MTEVLGLIIALVIVAFVIYMNIQSREQVFMKDAYDRGFAVQCVGKAGYYWECEDEQ